MRRRRVNQGDGFEIVVFIACLLALILAVGIGSTSYGQSSVDDTQPVAGAAVESTPVRGNFGLIKADLDNLFQRFPGTTPDGGIPRWSTSDGFMGAPSICFQFDASGSLANRLECYGNGYFAHQNNSTSRAVLSAFNQGGTGNLFRLGTSTANLYTFDNQGNLTTDFGGTAKHDWRATDGSMDYEGDGLVNDVYRLNCTTLNLGDCQDIRVDGTTRWQMGSGGRITSTVSSSSSAMSITQQGAGPMLTVSGVETGDDPTETWVRGRAATTDATKTTLITITPTDSTVIRVEVDIWARVTGGVGGFAGAGVYYKLVEGFKKVSGTVTRLEGSAATALEAAEDSNLSAYAVTLEPSSGTIIITGTAQADDNTTWHALAKYSQVGS